MVNQWRNKNKAGKCLSISLTLDISLFHLVEEDQSIVKEKTDSFCTSQGILWRLIMFCSLILVLEYLGSDSSLVVDKIDKGINRVVYTVNTNRTNFISIISRLFTSLTLSDETFSDRLSSLYMLLNCFK